MKKTILTSVVVLLFLCIAIVLQECNEKNFVYKDTDTYYDMGSGIYREPFVGILSSRPKILVWTLDIPPYKYFVDDTLRFKRDFNVEFNDESIRYYKQIGKESNIKFIPQDGVRYTPSNIKIAAKGNKLQFSTVCSISPSLGDIVTTTKMELFDAAVDEINSQQIAPNGYAKVKDCRAEQQIGKPWVLWYLWLLTAILPIVIIILLTSVKHKE